MPLYDPCLGPSGVGLLDQSGKLTTAARDSFTAQVVTLLTSGNKDGKGAKISSLLNIPFPPVAGPKFPDPDRLLTNPTDLLGDLFWFDPSPFAPLTFDLLRDPEGGYQKNIVDVLYQPVMQAFNQNGKNPLLFFDPSGVLPPIVMPKLDIPSLLKIVIALNTPPQTPQLLLAIAKELDIPEIGEIPIELPKLIPPIPQLPQLPGLPAFDFVVFPKVILDLIALPAIVLPSLIEKLIVEPPTFFFPPDPGKLFELVLSVIIGPILEILKLAGLLAILPKLLVATFIVIIQNMVAAMVPLLLSQIIGTGFIVKFSGQALGLA